MTERPDGITRRTALGLGLAAGTTAAIAGTNALRNEFVSAAPLAPQALAAPIAGARYLGIDAYAFFPDKAADRVYQDLTGSQPVTPGRRIWAPLPLPAGSIIVQLSASYQGQPIMEISRRPLFSGTAATAPAQVFQQSMNPSPGGPFASSVVVPNLEIDREATYTISAYCSAGTSVIGASVGYLEGFTPFRGTVPRRPTMGRRIRPRRRHGPARPHRGVQPDGDRLGRAGLARDVPGRHRVPRQLEHQLRRRRGDRQPGVLRDELDRPDRHPRRTRRDARRDRPHRLDRLSLQRR
jgi:hypothetical protein